MTKKSSTWSKPHIYILLGILIIGLLLRSYKIIDRLEFGHDHDLFSWIVKDIVVDKHLRLIGQLTSAPGIFIGPAFYYALIPFFLVAKMDPIGAVALIYIWSVLGILSYYYVFTKLFNKTIGLIGAFLQSVLLSKIYFDLWLVPSTPTNLWVIWYFYVVFQFVRGNFKVWWMLAILVASIWHIHIALLPTLIAIPASILIGKRFPIKKQILSFLLLTTILSLPLILFETRHNFSQTLSLINNFGQTSSVDRPGVDKFLLVITKLNANLDRLLFYPHGAPVNKLFLLAGILLATTLSIKHKIINIKESFVILAWLLGVIFFYSFTSSPLSEYYLANLDVLFIATVSTLIYIIYTKKTIGTVLILVLFLIILGKNTYFYINEKKYERGYKERKAVASFITSDSRIKGYPCISVSYVTSPGENVGFRYFFWQNKLHVNQPASGSPVYTIVTPIELVTDDIKHRFGQIGIIPPTKVGSSDEIATTCMGDNANLTDPMLGFTK